MVLCGLYSVCLFCVLCLYSVFVLCVFVLCVFVLCKKTNRVFVVLWFQGNVLYCVLFVFNMVFFLCCVVCIVLCVW